MNENRSAAASPVCHPGLCHFPAVKKRTVSARFTGGEVTGDGGITLLRQADRRIGLTEAPARVLPDPRDPERIEHPLLSRIRQRIYGLANGGGTGSAAGFQSDVVPAGEPGRPVRGVGGAGSAGGAVH
jgi:hypothetical protein